MTRSTASSYSTDMDRSPQLTEDGFMQRSIYMDIYMSHPMMMTFGQQEYLHISVKTSRATRMGSRRTGYVDYAIVRLSVQHIMRFGRGVTIFQRGFWVI